MAPPCAQVEVGSFSLCLLFMAGLFSVSLPQRVALMTYLYMDVSYSTRYLGLCHGVFVLL